MPSTRKMTTKSGKVFYEISVSRGAVSPVLPADGMCRRAGAKGHRTRACRCVGRV